MKYCIGDQLAMFCKGLRGFVRGLWFSLSFSIVVATAAGANDEDEAASVVVVRVTEAKVNSGRRVVGTVMPIRSSTIGSGADGRVVEYLINNGDAVAAGQTLAQLRTGTLEIELAATQAELKLYQEQLAEQRNGSRPEDIDEARAKMRGAKAAMDNAVTKLRRIEALSISRATSETDLGDARERAEFFRHVFLAAEALLKRVEEGPRVEQIAQAQARVELQKERVRLIEDRIAKHTIVAPFGGYVAAEFTEVGAWISQGDPVAQIIQLDEVEIKAPAPAEYAIRLRRGDTIRVEFPELPDELFMGKVDRVVPMADARTRTFPVYIRMKNQIHDGMPLLMAGMLARVDLPAGQLQTLPFVPKDALVLNGKERSVYVVELDAAKNNVDVGEIATARKVLVQLGVAAAGLIQIRGEIRPDQFVVVVGNERLRDGDRVIIQSVVDTESPSKEKIPRRMLGSRQR